MTTINLILSIVIFLEIAAGLAYAGAVISIYLGEMGAFVSIFAWIIVPVLVVVGAGLYLVMDYTLTTPILALIQGAIMVFIYRAFRAPAQTN
jgi:hypothetical protein